MRPPQRTTAELEAELDFTLRPDPEWTSRLHHATHCRGGGYTSLVDFEAFHELPDRQLELPLRGSRIVEGASTLCTTRWAVALVAAGLCAWLTGHRATTTSGPALARLFDYPDAAYQAGLAIVWAPLGARICLVPETLRWLFIPEEPIAAAPANVIAIGPARQVNRELVDGFAVHRVAELEGGRRVDAFEHGGQ